MVYAIIYIITAIILAIVFFFMLPASVRKTIGIIIVGAILFAMFWIAGFAGADALADEVHSQTVIDAYDDGREM